MSADQKDHWAANQNEDGSHAFSALGLRFLITQLPNYAITTWFDRVHSRNSRL